MCTPQRRWDHSYESTMEFHRRAGQDTIAGRIDNTIDMITGERYSKWIWSGMYPHTDSWISKKTFTEMNENKEIIQKIECYQNKSYIRGDGHIKPKSTIISKKVPCEDYKFFADIINGFLKGVSEKGWLYPKS